MVFLVKFHEVNHKVDGLVWYLLVKFFELTFGEVFEADLEDSRGFRGKLFSQIACTEGINLLELH